MSEAQYLAWWCAKMIALALAMGLVGGAVLWYSFYGASFLLVWAFG